MSGDKLANMVLGRELAWVADPDLRHFVEEAFHNLSPASHYFWTRPAAKGGSHIQYHPVEFRGAHGLVGHTRLVAYLVFEARRAVDGNSGGSGNDPSPHSCEMVAAALLHDVMKDGDPGVPMTPERKKIMRGYHGVEMVNAIMRTSSDRHLENPRVARVLRAIGGHMGPWTLPEEWMPDRVTDPRARLVAMTLHQCDYLASRPLSTEIAGVTVAMTRMPQFLREMGHGQAQPVHQELAATPGAVAAGHG